MPQKLGVKVCRQCTYQYHDKIECKAPLKAAQDMGFCSVPCAKAYIEIKEYVLERARELLTD